jgi:AraC-like DNA-binding protein
MVRAEATHLQLAIVEREHDILFTTCYPDMRSAPGYAVSQSYQIEVFLSVIRHFLGQSWYPDEIAVEQTHVSQQLKDHWGGARISPNSRVGYLSVPRSCLHVAPPLTTSANGYRGESEQEPVLASESDFTATLRSLLRAYLSEGYPSSARIASLLGVSRRTLARRLEAEGTNFSALVDEVRFNRAKHLLGNTRLGIAEISAATGFEDHSHFTRMFRRIGGITPAQFRKEVQVQLT